MLNFGNIINSYNKNIINNNILKPSNPSCNSRVKVSGPLNGDCLQSSLVYICKANSPNMAESQPQYFDLAENIFKDRFYKHKNCF